jgi:hypothetical protein
MKFSLEDRLRQTSLRHHDDLVDSFAYMIAGMEAELIDRYCLMHVKQRPWWLPDFMYKWLLGQLLVLSYFKK